MDFRTVDIAGTARLIFVGDIHGCRDELQDLLQRVAPAAGDVVISVGDMVNKGPDPVGCLELWRERGFLAVKGNHEVKLLKRARPLLRWFAGDPVLRRGDLVRYIRSWPLVLDIPTAECAAVHGGFLPKMTVSAEDVAREGITLTELRWIRNTNGRWTPVPKTKKRKGDVLWSEQWRGNRFAVYGHTPLREPKRDPLALGLDTGCVYGGSLTAAIWSRGQWSLESVRARRAYAE